MDLSRSCRDGLLVAGNPSLIKDSAYKKIVRNVLSSLKGENAPDTFTDADVVNSDHGSIKAAYAALAILAAEGTKHDADAESLSSCLEEARFAPDRTDHFLKAFQTEKLQLQALLGSFGSGPPHIVDVDWRLDYVIKTNAVEKVDQPMYLISLKTETPGCHGPQDVQFSCSMEQLQDLVGKLKDASKSFERLGQTQ